jgi:hypothetical protein
MTVVAQTGQTFVAQLLDAPPNLTTVGVRVDRAGATVIPRSTLVQESPTGSGAYFASLTAPATPGDDYLIVWDTGGTDPLVATEELRVEQLAQAINYRPSVEDVAALLHARTAVHGVYQGTFTPETFPTAAQVELTAGIAAADLALRLGSDLPASQYDEARHVAALRAATLVETSYFPDDDSPVLEQYRAMYLDGVAALGGRTSGDGTGDPQGPNRHTVVPVRRYPHPPRLA